jgi:serine/threonine-protein kinase
LKGLVHRDLKPQNVMLEPSETPGVPLLKILDFGIGKFDEAPASMGLEGGNGKRHATLVGAPMGTPEYMSPEQVRATSDVDWRCDVWALAVVAYEILTGICPFEGRSITDTMFRVLSGSREPILVCRPDLPEATGAVFARAFAPRLEDRFDSALAFADALRAVAAEDTTATPLAADSAAPGPVARASGSPSRPAATPIPQGVATARNSERETADPTAAASRGAPTVRARRPQLLVALALASALAFAAVVGAPRTRNVRSAEPSAAPLAPARTDLPPVTPLAPAASAEASHAPAASQPMAPSISAAPRASTIATKTTAAAPHVPRRPIPTPVAVASAASATPSAEIAPSAITPPLDEAPYQ